MTQNHLTPDDLHWNAFQYVAGEMSDTEAADFELRMLDDLDACQAVIRCMQTCEAITATFGKAIADPTPTHPVVEPARNQSRRRVSIAVVVAGAAAVLTAMGIHQNSVNLSQTAEKSELVRMWSTAESEVAISEDADSTEAALAGDFSVPDWLLAAVEARAEEADEDIIEN